MKRKTTPTSCERLVLVIIALAITLCLTAYARTTEEPSGPPDWSMQP